MKILSKLILSATVVMTLASSTIAFAQKTKNDLEIQTNSLLQETIKRH